LINDRLEGTGRHVIIWSRTALTRRGSACMTSW
jgi:hypothetical protein